MVKILALKVCDVTTKLPVSVLPTYASKHQPLLPTSLRYPPPPKKKYTLQADFRGF